MRSMRMRRPLISSVAAVLVAAATLVPLGGQTRAGASFEAIDRDARAGVYGNIDALVVMRGDRTLMDARYPRDYRGISRGRTGPIGCGEGCTDASWMHEFNYFHPDWHPYYRGRDIHTLQSVTKSIAATLVGIALGRGDLPSLDRPFLPYVKEFAPAKIDPRLARATIDDVLTMRTGIEWHETDRPLNDTNTTLQLEKSRDWLRFTLEQPMDADPGAKWAYNSGGSMLLSGIIRSATGRFIDEYAVEHLFTPLGIREFHWKKTPTGHPDTEGGLYLSAEALARIGVLYLKDGILNGRRVLPEGWVRRATTRHVTGVGPGWDYGYQWWLTTRNGVDVWAGRGFGGQFLLVIPSRDTVAVVHAWNIFGGAASPIMGPLLDVIAAAPASAAR
jgi:hypothetical protein